ncbi:hypothetical protein [Marinigracilibium pacificum]|uniref:DNA polymerase-3 subunit gamma/tau n=1 Tax=Marinigracilibium pacificum TaxID=2729599 RepID=A0A848J507_9BACT|nr:hypothetical protein [Marinigracilibium pacificum]NMM49544.1 hypothetical protein [Marinigracilibium pacificum]
MKSRTSGDTLRPEIKAGLKGNLKKSAKLPDLNSLKQKVSDSTYTNQESVQNDSQDENPTNTFANDTKPGEKLTFNKENIKTALTELQEKVKNSSALFQVMLKQPFKIKDDGEIILSINSSVQEELFKERKGEIYGYLKSRIDHPSLTLSHEVAANDVTGNKLYTDRDKFDYLKNEVPLLKDLIDRLGLDPES